MGKQEPNTLNTCLDKEERLEQIIEAHRTRLFMIARSYESGDHHSDLCKEILLGIWMGLDGKAERTRPETWIYNVALNTALNWEGNRARPAAPSAGSRSQAGIRLRDSSDPRAAVRTLYEFMHSLEGTDRAIFLLCLDVFSCREMSEITGLDEARLRVKANRLKDKFMDGCMGGASWTLKD